MLFGQLLLIFFPENIISFFQNYFEYFRQVLHLAATPEYLSSFVQKRIGELQTMPLILRSRFLLPFFSLLIFTLIIQTRLWQTWKNRGLLLLLATLLTTSLTLTLRTPLQELAPADVPAARATLLIRRLEEYLRGHTEVLFD